MPYTSLRRYQRVPLESLTGIPKPPPSSRGAPTKTCWNPMKRLAAEEIATIRIAFARNGDRAVQKALTLNENASESEVHSVIEEINEQRSELTQEIDKAVADLFNKIRGERDMSGAPGEMSRAGKNQLNEDSDFAGSRSSKKPMINRSTQTLEQVTEPAVILNNTKTECQSRSSPSFFSTYRRTEHTYAFPVTTSLD